MGDTETMILLAVELMHRARVCGYCHFLERYPPRGRTQHDIERDEWYCRCFPANGPLERDPAAPDVLFPPDPDPVIQELHRRVGKADGRYLRCARCLEAEVEGEKRKPKEKRKAKKSATAPAQRSPGAPGAPPPLGPGEHGKG